MMFRIVILILFFIIVNVQCTSLNDLIKDRKFIIPEQSIDALGKEDLIIGQITCNDISIDDLIVDHTKFDNGTFININVNGISFHCTSIKVTSELFDFKSVTMSSLDSKITTILKFQQIHDENNDNIIYPMQSNLDTCHPQLNVDLIFDSDLQPVVQTGLELVEEFIFRFFQTEIDNLLCKELKSFIVPLISNGIKNGVSYIKHEYQIKQDNDKNYDPIEEEGKLGLLVKTKDAFGIKSNNDLFTLVKLIMKFLKDISTIKNELNSLPLQSLIQEQLQGLYNSNSLKLPLNVLIYNGGDKVIHNQIILNKLEIFGLDTLHTIDIFKPVSFYTFENSIQFQSLKFKIHFNITLSLTQTQENENHIVKTGFIEVEFDDLLISFNTILALSLKHLANIKFGAITTYSLFNCIYTSLLQLKFVKFNTEFNRFDNLPMIQFNEDDDLGRTLTQIFTSSFVLLETSLHEVIPDLFSIGINKVLVLLNEKIKLLNLPCINEIYNNDHFIQFNKISKFTKLASWLKNSIIPNLNTYVPDKVELLNNELVVFNTNTNKFGEIKLSMKAIKITNIETLNSIYLLELIDTKNFPYEIHNSLNIGKLNEPLRISINFNLLIKSNTFGNEFNDFIITFEIVDLLFLFNFIIKIQESILYNVYISSLPYIACWLSMIDGGINQMKFQFNKVNFKMQCNKCESKAIHEIYLRSKLISASDDLTYNINSWMQTFFNKITSLYRLGNFNNYITNKCNAKENIENSFINLLLNENDNNNIFSFLQLTDNTKQYELNEFLKVDNEINHNVHILPVAIIIIVLLFISSIYVCIITNKYNKSIDKMQYNFDDNDETINNRISISSIRTNPVKVKNLFNNKNCPTSLKIILPLLIIINITMFIMGHIMIGAIVSLHVEIADKQYTLPQVATFSLGQSIKGMWKAKAYPLAILIASLSGIWPYTKLLLLTYSLFASERWLSVKTRTNLLYYLDLLGKWSLIDVYVLVLCIVAFDIDIISPSLILLPSNFYFISVRIIPSLGLVSFTIAALLSIFINNIFIELNRHVVESENEINDVLWTTQNNNNKFINLFRNNPYNELVSYNHDEDNDLTIDNENITKPNSTEKIAPMNAIIFSDNINSLEQKYRLGNKMKFTIILLCIISIVLIFLGSFQYIFSIEINGIIGTSLNINNDTNSMHKFTTYSFAKEIIHSSIDHYKNIGSNNNITTMNTLEPIHTHLFFYTFLMLSYILTSVIIPMLYSILLLILFTTPLTLNIQRKLLNFCEGLNAWSALEVFLISLIIAALELSQVSSFLIGKMCNDVQPFIDAYLVPLGILWTKDGTCLKVHANIEISCYYLIVSLIIQSFLSQIIIKLTKRTIYIRSQQLIPNYE